MSLLNVLVFSLIIITFIGLGSPFTKQNYLSGIIGISVFMIISGWLLLLTNSSGYFINILQLTLGCILFLWYYKRYLTSKNLLTVLIFIPLVLLTWNYTINPEGYLLSWTTPPQLNEGDDSNYLHLVNKYLYNGNLVDPFNLRRALSLGGFQAFQSVPMTFFGAETGYIADIGIAHILLWVVILGYFSQHINNQYVLWLLVGIFVTIDVPRYNTNASSIVVLQVLGTFIAFSRKEYNIAGIIIASAVLTRAYTLLTFGIIILGAIKYIPPKQFISLSVVILVSLLPWAIQAVQSADTPFFPIYSGNINKTYLELSAGTIESFSHLANPILAILFIVPVLLIVLHKDYVSRLFYIGSIVTAFVLLFKLGKGETSEVYRYCFGILFPCLIFGVPNLVNQSKKLRLLTISLILMIFIPNAANSLVQKMFQAIHYGAKPADQSMQVQQYITKNSTILVASDYIYTLDYNLNNILSLDILGATAPGFSWDNLNEDELRAILKRKEIDYIIIQKGNKGTIYNTNYWYSPPKVIEGWAKSVLKVFALLEALQDERTIHTKDYTIIKL